jgi:hypothetical protein
MLPAPATVIQSTANVIPLKQPDRGFFKLHNSLLSSTNWQSTNVWDRANFFEVVSRYTGFNNGDISYSIRDAKAALHIGNAKADRSFQNLETRELLIRRQRGQFNFKAKADRDTKWEIAPLALGAHPSTVNTNGANGHCAQLSTVNARTVLAASTNKREDLNKDRKEPDSIFGLREGRKGSGLPRQRASKTSEDPSTPTSAPINGVVPRGAELHIRYNTPAADLVECFRRAHGQEFVRSNRWLEFAISKFEWDAAQAWAASAEVVS